MMKDHTIQGLPTFVESLRHRLWAKTGENYAYVQISATSDGWRVYFSPDGQSFAAPFLDEVIAKAEAWLDRDQQAEINLTLGLMADGTLAP